MQKNLGVLVRPRQPKDYIAGASPIPYQVVNPTGDWRPYEPTAENQYSPHADSMACVSYSMVHAIESQILFLTGEVVRLSPRFVAKISNTTIHGNYQAAVAEAIRLNGVCLESEWPTPIDFTWDSYYAEIPQDVKDKAKKFLDTWNFKYEFVNEADVAYHLKQAPLQVVIVKENPYHAQETLVVLSSNPLTGVVWDTYQPYEKPLQSPYDFLKALITKKNMSNVQFVHKVGTQEYGFYMPAITPDAVKDKALNFDVPVLNASGGVDFTKAVDISGLK